MQKPWSNVMVRAAPLTGNVLLRSLRLGTREGRMDYTGGIDESRPNRPSSTGVRRAIRMPRSSAGRPASTTRKYVGVRHRPAGPDSNYLRSFRTGASILVGAATATRSSTSHRQPQQQRSASTSAYRTWNLGSAGAGDQLPRRAPSYEHQQRTWNACATPAAEDRGHPYAPAPPRWTWRTSPAGAWTGIRRQHRRGTHRRERAALMRRPAAGSLPIPRRATSDGPARDGPGASWQPAAGN